MPKNLFITGEKRIGKSSLVRKIIEPYRNAVGGFFIQRIYKSGKKDCAFRLVDLSSKERYQLEINSTSPCTNYSNVFLRRSSTGIYYRNIEVFDTVGRAILLSAIRASTDLIVLDEIGRFEDRAKFYINAVEDVLNSYIPVLGVMQKAEGQLIRQIINRSDIMVVELSETNFDVVENKIVRFLTQNSSIKGFLGRAFVNN